MARTHEQPIQIADSTKCHYDHPRLPDGTSSNVFIHNDSTANHDNQVTSSPSFQSGTLLIRTHRESSNIDPEILYFEWQFDDLDIGYIRGGNQIEILSKSTWRANVPFMELFHFIRVRVVSTDRDSVECKEVAVPKQGKEVELLAVFPAK